MSKSVVAVAPADNQSAVIFGPSDDPAPIPDAPAAGEPLLNDIELNNSNQFFEKFQHDYLVDDSKLLETLGPYSHESIPSFFGVSVTLPQHSLSHSSPVHNLDFTSFGGDLTARFGQTQLASPTAPNYPHLQNLDHFSLLSHDSVDSKRRQSDQVFRTPELFTQHQRLASRNASSRSSVPTLPHDSRKGRPQTSRPSFGENDNAHSGDSRRKTLPPVSFGSDLAFRKQSYDAPDAALIEAKSREHMFRENLRTFETPWPDEQSRPPSPPSAPKRRLSSANLGERDRNNLNKSNVWTADKQCVEEDERVKRCKKTHDDSDDATDDSGSGSIPQSATVAKSCKKARPKNKSRTLSDTVMPPPSRRKSQTLEPKSSRQNLTENEKKQNHIRSEQKRRNQIREGFADLTVMMPQASSANLSKCAILSHAVDWLSGLIEGNEKLRAQLARMER